jgi:hypothetical protein
MSQSGRGFRKMWRWTLATTWHHCELLIALTANDQCKKRSKVWITSVLYQSGRGTPPVAAVAADVLAMPLAPLPGLPVWNPWACHEPRSCRPVRDPPACQRQSQFLIKCTDYRLSALTARARGSPGLDLSQQSAQSLGKLLHDKIVSGRRGVSILNGQPCV